MLSVFSFFILPYQNDSLILYFSVNVSFLIVTMNGVSLRQRHYVEVMNGTDKQLSDKKLKALLGVKRDSPAMIAAGEGLSIKVFKSGQLSWVFIYR